jgi:hypothetical protein
MNGSGGGSALIEDEEHMDLSDDDGVIEDGLLVSNGDYNPAPCLNGNSHAAFGGADGETEEMGRFIF